MRAGGHQGRAAVQVVGGQAFDQLQTEVRAHAGAQHKRPSAAVPPERQHLTHAKGRRAAGMAPLPASCKRSSTTVAASGSSAGAEAGELGAQQRGDSAC